MIITAPEFKEIEGPLCFLAGPIQGADDWQRTACNLIVAKQPLLNIANPRGDYSNRELKFDAQVDWESFHLSLASKSAGILFWLANEKEHFCERAYGQSTRFELAEWITKHVNDKKVKIFVGVDSKFSGARYIRRRMGQNCPEITIHTTLEDVCDELVVKSNA